MFSEFSETVEKHCTNMYHGNIATYGHSFTKLFISSLKKTKQKTCDSTCLMKEQLSHCYYGPGPILVCLEVQNCSVSRASHMWRSVNVTLVNHFGPD